MKEKVNDLLQLNAYTDQQVVQEFIKEDALNVTNSLLENKNSNEVWKKQVEEWTKSGSSVSDNLQIQKQLENNEYENITLFKDIKNNWRYSKNFKIINDDNGFTIDTDINTSDLVTKNELTTELEKKQNIKDDNLKTDVKEITPAINEVLTKIPDISQLATKDELNLKADKTQLDNYALKTDLDNKQNKDNNQDLETNAKSIVSAINEVNNKIPNLDNYATKTYVDNKVSDKADKTDLEKIQISINYPGQLTQSFLQTIDLERNYTGLNQLKTALNKYFTQRHYFKFDSTINFNTSTNILYKTEIIWKNNSLIIDFTPSGKAIVVSNKTYEKILYMKLTIDYDTNFTTLNWHNWENEKLAMYTTYDDPNLLTLIQNEVLINLRDGYGTHYGKINWSDE